MKWETGYRDNYLDFKFKGIKSNVKAEDGKIIRSGQKVKMHGRFSSARIEEVIFEPNHGFKISGENLADAYVLEVVKQVSIWDRIIGNIKFFFFSLC